MISYLWSFFSAKKYFYNSVSIFSIWDQNTRFTNKTLIDRFSKLKNSTIGRYSRINRNCIIANADIGNFTGVSYGTQIGTGGHPLNYASTSILFHKKNKLTNKWVEHIPYNAGRVTIGNDVWVGINCLILDGVSIGDGAVIGAGSIVTKDIPPYAIAAGVPAKVKKYRFDRDVIDRLLEIKWWDLSDAEIDNNIGFFREKGITLDTLNKYFPKE